MAITSVLRFFTFALLLFAVCYGKVHLEENTSSAEGLQWTTNFTATPVLLHSYDDDNAPRGVVIAVPIVSLLLIGCCIYFCCRCRSQRNQGMVMNLHPPPQPPATQIVIQQNAAPPPQPTVQTIPYPQQHVPTPTYGNQQFQPPQQQQYPPPQQQQYPPPQQQQYPPPQQQQFPTSYENPNYGQPPVNPYGQEKY